MSLNFKYPPKGDIYIPEKDLLESKDLNPENSAFQIFDFSKKIEQPKNNQILSEGLVQSQAAGPLQISNLQNIKNDIYNFIKNNINPASPVFEDLKKNIQNLKENGDIFDENFIGPWYITIVFLDMLNEHSIMLKIYSSLQGSENLRQINQDFRKYFKIILYLIGKVEFSLTFKSKILRNLDYNITILNEKTEDNQKPLIVLLLDKEDFNYLDLLIRESKSAHNCKSHTIEEMENSIILEISHKIVAAKTQNIFKIRIGVSSSPKKKEGWNSFKGLKQELIEYCVAKKLNQITKILFGKFPNEALSIHTINLAFESKCYEYLKDANLMNRIRKILIDKSIMEKIIAFLKQPETFLDAIFFLYEVKDYTLQQETQKLLHETFRDILQDPEKNKIFLYNLNPLLIFVMLAQTFHHLSKKCFHYQHSFKKYSGFLEGIASKIVEKYDHFYNLKRLAFQIFYPARIPLIRMIFEDKEMFDPMFQDDRLAKITRFQLNSFYVFDWNVLACSTSFKYMIFNRSLINEKPPIEQNNAIPKKQTTKEMRLDLFLSVAESIQKTLSQEKLQIGVLKIFNYISKLKIEEVNNQENHCYQHKIYLKSVAYRTIMDAIIFMVLFVYLHVNTNEFSNIRKAALEINPNYTEILNTDNGIHVNDTSLDLFSNSTALIILCTQELASSAFSSSNSSAILDTFLTPCIDFHTLEYELFTTSTNLMYLCFIIIVTYCNVFIRKLYQIFLKKTFHLLMIDQLDLFALGWVIIIIILNYNINTTFFQSPDQLISDINLLSIFIALLLFTFWLQMVQYIKLTQNFGYIIKTVELLISETYEFLWIFFLFIAAFASINLVLFGSLTDVYQGFFISVRTLFGYAMGNFQFLDNAPDYYTIMSAFINIFYVLFTNVILINLLIALLSSIYQKIADNSDLEYSSIIYDLREEKYFDKTYGSITIYPRVINIFLFPIHLMIIYAKSPRFNLMIGNIGYYLSLMFYVLLFLFLHIFIIPMAWTNIFVLILLNKYHDNLISTQVTMVSKITHIVIWIALGIPYLTYVMMCNDLTVFFKNAFYSNKTKKSETSPLSLLEYETLKRLLKQLKYYTNEIETNIFIKKYLAIAKSMEASNNIFFQKSKELLSLRTSAMLKDIKAQDTSLGFGEFEKRNNQMEFKLKKMIYIINGFSIKKKISLTAMQNVMNSLKIQMRNSKKKDKLQEITKLEVVNYRDIYEILEHNLNNFLENK